MALRIWPELDGVRALYDKAFEECPTLDVAVTDVAAPLGPWIHSPADDRITRLLYRPILASDDDDARKGKKPGQLAESIESSDLGRRLLIRIRSGFLWSDGSRPASGDRRGTRPGRPYRSPFAAVRSALGRSARPRRDRR